MLSSQFPLAKQLSNEIELQLGKLDDAITEKNVDVELQADVKRDMSRLEGILTDMNACVEREAPSRKVMWSSRVSQLAQEQQQHSYQLNKLTRKMDQLRQREALFADMAPAGGGDGAIDMSGMEAQMREHAAINNSISMVDNYTAMGRQALNDLRASRVTIKGARKKLLDVGNSLGLSKSVLKMIEKKENANKLITYSGICCTTFIIGWAVWYFRM
jgi:Golgi SNAP receptor complex protein 2